MNFLKNLIQASSLTPNQLYLLYCLYVDETPIQINFAAEIRALKVSKYVSSSGKITDKGIEIAQKIPVSKKSVKKPVLVITDEMVDAYLTLFPKGKLPSGKLARSDKKNIKNNFEWFFKTYSYSWENVIQATSIYVDEYEKKNYLYMKTSQYFISKSNPDRTRESELANYCASLANGDYQNNDNHFSEKVV